MGQINGEALERLFQTILALESMEECRSFFDDICTIKELRDLSQRLEVAFLLNRGMSYQAVAAASGVSSATICRVKKCLDYGTGYRTAIAKHEAAEAEAEAEAQ